MDTIHHHLKSAGGNERKMRPKGKWNWSRREKEKSKLAGLTLHSLDFKDFLYCNVKMRFKSSLIFLNERKWITFPFSHLFPFLSSLYLSLFHPSRLSSRWLSPVTPFLSSHKSHHHLHIHINHLSVFLLSCFFPRIELLLSLFVLIEYNGYIPRSSPWFIWKEIKSDEKETIDSCGWRRNKIKLSFKRSESNFSVNWTIIFHFIFTSLFEADKFFVSQTHSLTHSLSLSLSLCLYPFSISFFLRVVLPFSFVFPFSRKSE